MVPVSSSYRRTVFTTHSCYGPWCLQHLFLYLRNKFAKHCVSKSINPFIEGQPLQQELGKSLSDWSREKFQSLYRGTAFATVLGLTQSLWLKGFNPSIEGQPLQQVYYTRIQSLASLRFNPSIEGQPLQQSRCRSLYFQ